jgi:hypothetical protein
LKGRRTIILLWTQHQSTESQTGIKQTDTDYAIETTPGSTPAGSPVLTEQNINEHATKAIPTSPKGPSLAELALAATQSRAKNALLNKGDILVILDNHNLAKAVTLDQEVLEVKTPKFAQQHLSQKQPYESDGLQANGVKKLLVLQAAKENNIPVVELQPLDLLAPLELASESTSGQLEQVKAEKAEGEDGSAHTSADTDWLRVYEAFFRILHARSMSAKSVRMYSTAAASLPLIEKVSMVAEEYAALDHMSGAVKSLVSDWIDTTSLWSAIAAEPVRWLKVAIKLQDDVFYKEAFIHVVGQKTDVAGLDDSVLQAISSLRQAIEARVSRANFQLLTSSTRVDDRLVDQFHKPTVYNAVNVWRDWISEHLATLSPETNGPGDRSTWLCDHPFGECLTVAGLYRTVSAGTYLGDATGHWSTDYKCKEAEVRCTLITLKAQAKEVVAGLEVSSLQYEKKDNLPYLTRVEKKDIKVPWAADEDEDMDDRALVVTSDQRACSTTCDMYLLRGEKVSQAE